MTDITRYRGDTAADEITVQDASGNAVNVTGYNFTLTVSTIQNPKDTTAQLFQIAGVITNGAAGQVEFVPTPTQADQKPATYYYDIQMEDTSVSPSRLKTLVKGSYTFTQDITK